MQTLTKAESIAYLRKLQLRERVAEESKPLDSADREEEFREIESDEKE